MKKLNFAIIGCGRISLKHTENLKNKLKKAHLVSVCDIVEAKARKLGELYKVNWYTSYDEMLQTEQIDVVCILTESGNHAKHTIDVLRKYSKHVVVEKPMALTIEDADAMIETAKNVNKKLFVVKQNRYNLPVTKLRQAIDDNRFGKLIMGTVRVRWCRTQDYYNLDPWRGTYELDGGVFTNQASHHIDLLEWMLGEPTEVFAKGKTFLADIETEDTGVAVITFKSGAIGIVEATTATRPNDLEGSISILGENGSVVIAGFAVNEMQTWSFSNKLPGDDDVLRLYRENPPDVYGFGHLKYLENVCDVILEDEKPCVDGAEGKKSIILINAIYDSMKSKKEVPVKM